MIIDIEIHHLKIETIKLNGYNILDMRKNHANNEQHVRYNLSVVKCSFICNNSPDNHTVVVCEIQKI